MNILFENYQPAPISCLLPVKESDETKISALEIREKVHKLEKVLLSFGHVVDVKCGSSVIRFEIELNPGVKVSRIVGLRDDLETAMATYAIRIEAPVPGENVIAIEIPKEKIGTVRLRGLVDNEWFIGSSPLTVPIGMDLSQNPVYCDIAKLGNLLIAGSTGSGKQVFINAILSSILVHSSPEDVRMILVDTKIIELYRYLDIPHLLMPVINEPNKAVGALKWACIEMQRRYKLFEETNVRNIDEYNKKINCDTKEVHLPSILFVIDELAGLMSIVPRDVETCISRIAELAGAAGIHLIIATQFPSPCVITGVIKANICSRISFAVHAAPDSRCILDQCGAEKLIGKGDMLYAPFASSGPVRCQCVFITESEVDNTAGFLRKQFGPMYDESVVESVNRLSDEQKTPEWPVSDALFVEAVSFVVSIGTAGVSAIQRSMECGSPRALRLIESLEKEGIIGPRDGANPRKVLITEDEWLKARNVDIESVVSRYVTLSRKENALWGICPFHEEETPSFAVLANKRFKCYGCGKGGDAIRFIMEKEHLNCADAIRFIVELDLPEKLE